MQTDLKVIAVFSNDKTRRQMEGILSALEGINLTVRNPSEKRPLSGIGADELPDVVIMELDGHREQDLADIEDILNAYGNRIAVFATYADIDMDTMRRLMRAGVRDVFPQPVERQDVLMGMSGVLSDKRIRTKRAQGPRGGVTAFLNAKGGSGSTTLAVNVAHTLAVEHKADVALIDLDLQFGGSAMLFDLAPRATVMDALLQPDRIDPVFVQALMTQHKSGLDILASPGDLSSVEGISEYGIQQVIKAVVENYEFVILDVPRLFMPWTIAAMKTAEPIMLVIQNTLATIRDARVVLDALPVMGISLRNIELVNNRAMTKSSSVPIDKLKETLKKERVHRVRNGYAAAVRAQDEGVPISEISKRSEIVNDIQSLANYLVRTHRGEEEEEKPAKRWFGS